VPAPALAEGLAPPEVGPLAPPLAELPDDALL
jgi:hypothetical protein